MPFKSLLKQFISQFENLSAEEVEQLSELLQVVQHPAGTVLVNAGEISTACYFVLQGCLRQYQSVDGTERTTHFYTEQQAAVLYSSYNQQIPANSYLACVEDSVLIAGEMAVEQSMYKQFPQLEQITRSMMAQDLGKSQDDYARFVTLSPEERFRDLLNNRPELFQRVPQHQLASFIGVTPESFSRIKKRIYGKP